ncbi:eCIS core domain-containing protein [Aquimarina sp. 2304DJ70-9]|uniref:eCIS core domain-containing protein n=1 Tax=Aquimarina penaris TaxID=3231044 RepID=UPI003462813A
MKAPQVNTTESQKEALQRIQQEPGIGGEATIADNRPAIAIQRKLRSAIDDTKYSVNPIPVQRKASNTGLPDNLKSGVENLSGYSMDDVKVHYNSNKPAQLQAHAYAQGTDIHLGPGQEKHLPHEAWHVVQQKQGRVEPTRQLKSKVNINDDAGLEKEADVMGEKALQINSPVGNRLVSDGDSLGSPLYKRSSNKGTIQRFIFWQKKNTSNPKRPVVRFDKERPQPRPLPRPLPPKQDRVKKPIKVSDVFGTDITPLTWILPPRPQPRPQRLKQDHSKHVINVSDVFETDVTPLTSKLPPLIPEFGKNKKSWGKPISVISNLFNSEVEDKLWRKGGQMNMGIEKVMINLRGDEGIFKPEMDKIEDYKTSRAKLAGIPETKPNMTGRSIASYRIDQLLGAGIIPKTSLATKGTAFGSVMNFIKDAKPGSESHGTKTILNFKEHHQKERDKLYLMDIITGQIDRNHTNVLLQGKKVWGIDNDLAFGSKISFDAGSGVVELADGQVWPGFQLRDLKDIDNELSNKIIELSKKPDPLKEALEDLITPVEIEKTIERLTGLAEYLINDIENKKAEELRKEYINEKNWQIVHYRDAGDSFFKAIVNHDDKKTIKGKTPEHLKLRLEIANSREEKKDMIAYHAEQFLEKLLSPDEYEGINIHDDNEILNTYFGIMRKQGIRVDMETVSAYSRLKKKDVYILDAEVGSIISVIKGEIEETLNELPNDVFNNNDNVVLYKKGNHWGSVVGKK